MATQAEIATIACLDVGGQAISSIDSETQTEASLIRDIWDITLNDVLTTHEWGFAKEFKALALESEDETIDEKWVYVYALPKDYLSLLKNGNDFDREIRGQSLYCDEEDLIIGYIKKVEDVTKYPPWFVKALIARLRTKLYIPLAKKGSKFVDWYKTYIFELDQAMTEDALKDREADDNSIKHTSDNDTWVSEATS